jgi:TldD protein
MTESPRQLPFYEHFAIDAALAARVLERALSGGGDYADLFFEYRTSGSMVLDDQKVKEVERSIVLGLGIRVLKGEATGYAYTEDISPEGMLRAASTASAVAAGGGHRSGIEVHGANALNLYPIERPAVDADALAKLALLRRADDAARRYDPRIKRVVASLVETVKDVLIVTSDGRFVADQQPMIRFNVSAIAEDGAKRQSGNGGGGGRFGMEYFDATSTRRAR